MVTRRRSPEIESEIRRWSQKPRIGDKSRETSLKNSVSRFFPVIVMDLHFLFSFRLKYFHLNGGEKLLRKKKKEKKKIFFRYHVCIWIYIRPPFCRRCGGEYSYVSLLYNWSFSRVLLMVVYVYKLSVAS